MLLKQEITNRGIEGGIPAPNDEATIVDLDPIVLLEIQAAFGHLISGNPQLIGLINNLGPVLFATLLFTSMEAYTVSEDGETVTPTRDVFEAEADAIGMLRSVATALGTMYGEIAVEPGDAEVDADTDLVAIEAA